MPLTEYPARRAFPGVSGGGVVDHAAQIRIAPARR